MNEDSILEAAARARQFLQQLAGDVGLLHQIETGERDPAEGSDEFTVLRFLNSVGERARLDRILLNYLLG